MEGLSNTTQAASTWPELSPPQKPGELGRLGGYRVLKLLGEGGMGRVFQAEDTQLRRLVALKVMRPEIARHEDARSRFLREARAAAALKHDHIVTIYHVGEDRGVPYLAMELLIGKSLEAWLRPNRQATLPETLAIAKQAARGLAAAHAKGLIHRDIKPANLWLEAPRGRVKILDFGLARPMSADRSLVTQEGAVVGTPAFMAPEQARGEAIDPRCDLFSFGCVLYRIVAGRFPFQGNTTYAVLAAIAAQTPPPVRELNPNAPQPLADLIHRLLAKSPEERPASAEAVLEELQAIEASLKEQHGSYAPTEVIAGIPGARERRPLARWAPFAGAAAALVVAALALALSWGNNGGPAGAAPAPSAAAASQASLEAPSRQDASSDKTAEAPADAVDLAAAKSNAIDLLSLVDVELDAIEGAWSLSDGVLRGESDGEMDAFSLALPWNPPPTYRLSMTVTRLQGPPGYAAVGLAKRSTLFGARFDFPGPQRLLSSGVGLPIKADPPLKARHVGPVLPLNEPVQIVCAVEARRLLVTANGTVITFLRGDGHRLRRSPTDVPSVPLYLAGHAPGVFEFRDILLEPLGDDRGEPSRK